MARLRWLVTGASGFLGSELRRQLAGERVVAWTSAEDVTEADKAAVAFRAAQPDIVLHAAALARIDDCFRTPERARRINTEASSRLAELADAAGARFIYVSTDLVFDGERGNYSESDAPNPLSIYGTTKAAAEPLVLAHPRTAVARLSLLFGRGSADRPTFFDRMVAALRGGPPVSLFADERRTPLAVSAAAGALIALAKSDVTGLLHIGGPERLSRAEMGFQLAEMLDVPNDCFTISNRADAPAPEPRPRDTSLDSSRWRMLFPRMAWPSFRESV